jgi:type IV secretory pathway VirB9-like protein
VVLLGVTVSIPAPSMRLARTIFMTDRTIATIYARVRFSTVITLPRSEVIEDYAIGNGGVKPGKGDYWMVAGEPHSNICYVKPLRRGVETDLQLITESNHVYSFLLKEVSKSGGEPDLTVFVKRRDDDPPPKRVVAACDPALEKEVALEKQMAAEQKQVMSLRISALSGQVASRVDPAQFVASMQHDYKISRKLRHAPFDVTDIYHDGRFTYIRSEAQEQAAFYEIKDGKPRLTNYEWQNGVYIVPDVVARGLLRVGKKSATFTRR